MGGDAWVDTGDGGGGRDGGVDRLSGLGEGGVVGGVGELNSGRSAGYRGRWRVWGRQGRQGPDIGRGEGGSINARVGDAAGGGRRSGRRREEDM